MRKKSKKIKIRPKRKEHQNNFTELLFLSSFSQKLCSNSLREKGEEILKLMGSCVEFSSASLFEFNPETQKLEPVVSLGKQIDLIDFIDFDLGAGFSAWVAKQKRSVLLPHLKRSFNWENPVSSFVSVPLLYGDNLVGILNLSHIKDEAFGEKELKILEVVSGQLALSLAVAQKELKSEKLKKELEQTKESLAQIKNSLAELEKDKDVTEKAVLLREELNNPLAIISGNTQFLLSSLKNAPPSLKKRLKTIGQEITHIYKLAEKLSELKNGYLKSKELNKNFSSKTNSSK